MHEFGYPLGFGAGLAIARVLANIELHHADRQCDGAEFVDLHEPRAARGCRYCVAPIAA